MSEALTVCVDFDGTVVEPNDGPPFKLRPGAAEALRAMKAAGYVITLHSCRNNVTDPIPNLADEVNRFYATGEVAARQVAQWERFRDMRAFLLHVGLWDVFTNVWQSPGKPLAQLYIDDRAGAPDWLTLLKTYGATTHEQPQPLR